MSSIRSRAPSASSPLVRKAMQKVRRRDTTAELQLRKDLFRLGLRYRLHTKPVDALPCKADIVFRSARVCVFVDGCYWHGCSQHFRPPHTNASWWMEKIGDNRMRDRRQSRILRQYGWLVIRVWEHQITGDASKCAKRVFAAVRERLTH